MRRTPSYESFGGWAAGRSPRAAISRTRQWWSGRSARWTARSAVWTASWRTRVSGRWRRCRSASCPRHAGVRPWQPTWTRSSSPRARRSGAWGRAAGSSLVSSTAGQRGEAGHADYAATKGALISFTKSLAVEYAPDITVNCLAPGWVDTEMSAPAFGDGARDRIAATIPLRRIPPAGGHRGSDPLSLQRSRATRDRRSPQREWRERPVRVIEGR